MMPQRNKPVHHMTLGEDDLESSTVRHTSSNQPVNLYESADDYKQMTSRANLVSDVFAKLSKHAAFKQGLLGPARLLKVACVIETMCKDKVDKMQVAIEVITLLLDRGLTADELALIKTSINFLHQQEHIKASFVSRVIARLRHIFRQ